MLEAGRIVFSARAIRDLDAIGDYVAARSNEERAEWFLRSVDEKILLHANIPLGGQLRDALRPGMRSFPVGNYVVFYRPLKDGIRVLRILHASRDLERQNYSIATQ